MRSIRDRPEVTARFDHGPGNPADWTGVDDLQAYVSGVGECSTAKVKR